MLIHTTVGSKNIPEGAVRLTKEEVLQFQKKIISQWNSLTDVQVSKLMQIFLQYGWAFSSVTTFGSAVYVTGLVRSLLKVHSRARIVPYFITTLPSTVASAIWTEKKLTNRTLSMSIECPMCIQLKFAISQAIFSVSIPTTISLGVHLPLAYAYNTICLPDISKDARNLYKLCFKLLRSKALQFQMVTALQIPLILLLPYLQAKQLDKINEILRYKESEELE